MPECCRLSWFQKKNLVWCQIWALQHEMAWETSYVNGQVAALLEATMLKHILCRCPFWRKFRWIQSTHHAALRILAPQFSTSFACSKSASSWISSSTSAARGSGPLKGAMARGEDHWFFGYGGKEIDSLQSLVAFKNDLKILGGLVKNSLHFLNPGCSNAFSSQ